MEFGNIIMLLGGLGFLLYGMKMMSGGLETIAGDSMQAILRKATSNGFLAVLMGIVATIAINSSTATTIMTVSFVNSGMLTLTQSIGVIMGANVGTTFSAQLIAFGVNTLRLDIFSAALIFAGAATYVFARSTRLKNIGFVLLGFGIMFFGVTYMSDAMRPLRGSEAFQEFLISFSNPVLALLAGFVITAIIQSSTATTAILVTLLISGVAIPFQTVAFILLGVNIGTSLTTVISSIPANRESKRAAIFHIMYDIIGSVVFGSLILIFPNILNWFTTTWADNPAQQAAMFHTLYNVSTMLILLPFIKYIAKLMQKIIPIVQEASGIVFEKRLMYLDARTPSSPTVASLNAHMEVCRMGKLANENLALALMSFFNKDEAKAKKVRENEKVIDFLNHKITAKLASINRMALSQQETTSLSKMFVLVSEIERIGDHAANIAGYTTSLINANLEFSEAAIEELSGLSETVKKLTSVALNAYEKQDKSRISKVKISEKKIDKLTSQYIENHIGRLKNEQCTPEAGVIFAAIINDLERCADHAKNIAFSVTLERKWNK